MLFVVMLWIRLTLIHAGTVQGLRFFEGLSVQVTLGFQDPCQKFESSTDP